MLNYTEIPKEFREEYKKKFEDVDLDKVAELAEQDPTIFSYFFLGQKLRLHQAYIIHQILIALPKTKLIGPRIAMCIARQLGKSIAFCVFALWACFYNKYPATMFENTNIYITSRDDPAAKDVVKKIKKMIRLGDMEMVRYGRGHDFFTGSLSQPTNAYEITFLNDAYIGSFPPTLTALGKSASWFFVDEAHRLNCTDTDPETFFDNASSIVSETGGGICLSSSPQGTTGFFYKAIDPEKENPDNEYTASWWSHEIWDDGTKSCLKHKAFVASEKIRLTLAGRFKMWQQEHMASFTVTEESFFEHKDLEDARKETTQLYEYRDSLCSAGFDYGMNNSRTVITIRTIVEGVITEIFQFRGEEGFDNNLLHDPKWEHSIQKLKRRYDLSLGVYADDCPNGNDHNKWMIKHSGLQIFLYNFRSDQMSKKDGLNRNCVAYTYRARLIEGKLKLTFWNKIQLSEMKNVQEIEQKVNITIKAPTGYLCDTFDSDMLACIPFLDMKDIRDFSFDSAPEEPEMSHEDEFRRASYDYFHSPTDKECRKMIEEANNEEL